MLVRTLPARRRFLLGSAAAFATAGYLTAPAKAAEFEFKYASSLPGDHPFNVRVRQMFSAVEKESGGRIHLQYFVNSTLGGDPAMLSQLRLGAIQFNSIFWGNLAPVVPVCDIMSIGFAFKDMDEAVRVVTGPLGQYLREETAAKGIYALNDCWNAGMYVIGSNTHPIRTPEDLRGFKVRVPQGKVTVDLFKDLGAGPISLSLGETYTSLQSKLVDGEALSLATIEFLRFYEVNKYISLTNHAYSGLWIIANADAWKSLPPDLQAIIERNSKKYSVQEQQDIKALQVSLVDKLGRRGVGINPVDQTPFRALLGSYYEYCAGAFGTKAWGLMQSSLGRKLG